ncbi:hypothetical protein ACH347_30875 [Saccharopolyspora sp. 5N102]|uniref:hypothetical protein n=1 Tax=Saccharopolyspora sp. 5N102 TaxID=3375155 RepID=UPI0037B69F55
MTKLLLSIHVLAAMLVIGPITVAASMFPRYAKQAPESDRAAGIAKLLHRICRGYAVAGIAVPVFGLATGAQLGVLTDPWLIISIVLTAIAAAILVTAILPAQRRMLGSADDLSATATRLAMLTGIFNVLWVIVVVLMIVRPGSTTGA